MKLEKEMTDLIGRAGCACELSNVLWYFAGFIVSSAVFLGALWIAKRTYR